MGLIHVLWLKVMNTAEWKSHCYSFLLLLVGLLPSLKAPFSFPLQFSEFLWLLISCSDTVPERGMEESPQLLCLCCRLLWIGPGSGFQTFQLNGTRLQRSFSPPGQVFQTLNCNMRNRDCVLLLSKNKSNWGRSELLLKGKAPPKIAQCSWFEVQNEDVHLPIGSLTWAWKRGQSAYHEVLQILCWT